MGAVARCAAPGLSRSFAGMTSHINILTAQATITEAHRTARGRVDAGSVAASSRTRRRRPALLFAARLARPRVA
jgi:hypothetical protein